MDTYTPPPRKCAPPPFARARWKVQIRCFHLSSGHSPIPISNQSPILGAGTRAGSRPHVSIEAPQPPPPRFGNSKKKIFHHTHISRSTKGLGGVGGWGKQPGFMNRTPGPQNLIFRSVWVSGLGDIHIYIHLPSFRLSLPPPHPPLHVLQDRRSSRS